MNLFNDTPDTPESAEPTAAVAARPFVREEDNHIPFCTFCGSILDEGQEECDCIIAMEVRALTDAAGLTDPRKFAIDSEDRANWLLNKLANLDSEEARIKASTARALKRVQGQRDGLKARFFPELERWVTEERERRRLKTKLLPLLHGAAGYVARAARLVIANTQDALTTAKAVCPAVVTTETVEIFDTQAFLKYAKQRHAENKEILPGVKLEDATEDFTVRFEKAEKGTKE